MRSSTQISADYWTRACNEQDLKLANRMIKGDKEAIKEAEHLHKTRMTIANMVTIICAPVIVMVIIGLCWLIGFCVSTFGIMGILFNPITVFIGFIVTLCSH